MVEYGRKVTNEERSKVGTSQKNVLTKERFEVIHTGVFHWDYGQKPEDETREKER